MMGLALNKYEGEECPEVRHKRAGDGTYDMCRLNDKSCLIEHGLYECEYYNDFLKEVKDARTTNN